MKTILRLALGSVLAGAALTASAQTGVLLVKYKPNASATLLNNGIGARVLESYPQIGWQKIQLPASVTAARGMRYFQSLSGIAKVEQSYKPKARVLPNDPLIGQSAGTIYRQYQHQQINMPAAWDLSKGNGAVTVAVVDSGSRRTHEDLIGQTRADSANFTTGGTSTDISDGDGHGTHVSGLAAATANNGKGGAGTGWNVQLLTCKITYGTSGIEDFAKAIMYAADKNVAVINMSFGGDVYSQILDDACQYAFGKDVVLVAAAGNDNQTFCGYPSQLPNVLNVGSTDQGGGKSGFSNYGSEVDVAAPGGEIVSTATSGDSNYIVESGTSMASPVTAGAIAILRAYAPDLPNTAIVNAVINTAVQGSNQFTVHGQINIGAAILRLSPPLVTDTDPKTATVVTNEGTIVNPTGTPTTDAALLSDTDGSSLEIRSNYIPSLGTVTGLNTDFTVSSPAAKIITGRLLLTTKAASGVTLLVLMQNATTGAYDQVTSTRLSTAMSSIDLALPRPTLVKYLKSNGTVRVMLRAINPSRLAPGGSPFRTSVDSVTLRVTTATR